MTVILGLVLLMTAGGGFYAERDPAPDRDLHLYWLDVAVERGGGRVDVVLLALSGPGESLKPDLFVARSLDDGFSWLPLITGFADTTGGARLGGVRIVAAGGGSYLVWHVSRPFAERELYHVMAAYIDEAGIVGAPERIGPPGEVEEPVRVAHVHATGDGLQVVYTCGIPLSPESLWHGVVGRAGGPWTRFPVSIPSTVRSGGAAAWGSESGPSVVAHTSGDGVDVYTAAHPLGEWIGPLHVTFGPNSVVHSLGGVSEAGGAIALAATVIRDSSPSIELLESDDGGASWGSPVIVARRGDRGGPAFPILEAGTARWHLAYYRWLAPFRVDLEWRAGGRGFEWSPPVRVNEKGGTVSESRIASTTTAGDDVYIVWSELGPAFEQMPRYRTTAIHSVPRLSTQPLMLATVVPNPMQVAEPSNIFVDLLEPATVTLSLYGVSGRHKLTRALGLLAAGRHRVSWEGRDERPFSLRQGVYYWRIEAARDGLVQTTTRSVVVVR